jgi:hypothetical protein
MLLSCYVIKYFFYVSRMLVVWRRTTRAVIQKGLSRAVTPCILSPRIHPCISFKNSDIIQRWRCLRASGLWASTLNKKGKSVPQHTYGGERWEKSYSSYSFTNSALDGVGGQRHAPAAIYPRGKDPRYPLDRRLGRPQRRSGHEDYRKKSFRLCRGSNFDRPVVQSVVRHYTAWATPAPLLTLHPGK